MKKVLSLFLVLGMLIGILVGCGSGKDDNANSGTYNVVMQWPTVSSDISGLADVEAAVNAITGPEIGVTVTLEPANGFNLLNETSLSVSSGEKLDLCLSLFNGISPLVDTGSIIALDDLVTEYGSNILEECGKRIAGGYYGDTLYGIPNAYIEGEKSGYVCRTDLLEKYGIEVDENRIYTMDEIGDIFATIKAGEGDGFYCVAGPQNLSDLFNCLYPYDVLGTSSASGVLMLGNDFTSTTVENLYATEEYKNFAEVMYDWGKKGFFSPDATTTTEIAVTQIKSGKYLGFFPGFCSGGADYYNSQTGTDMTMITTIEGNSMTNMFQTILWSIPVTCENPEKTMEFLNYIYKNNEIATLLQYGIEGVSYEVVENTEEGTLIKFPDGQTTDTLPYYQMMGIYGNRLEWPILMPDRITYNKDLKEFSDSVDKISPALGYSFVTASVSSEYSAVFSVIRKYIGIINTGTINPDTELPEFIKALEDAGINKIIEENQKQLDAWLENQ